MTTPFPLDDVPLLRGLDAAALAEVHSLGVRRRLPAGAVLFHEGDEAASLYVLVSGAARVTRAAAGGQQVILHLLHPGEVAGCALLAGARRYPGTAELTEEGVVLAFGPQAVARLVDRHPKVARNALALLSVRMEDLRTRVNELCSERLEQRLARALLREEGPAPLRLGRQALAELVGSTQFSVSRLLSAWERGGVVETGRQWVRVVDAAALRVLAEG